MQIIPSMKIYSRLLKVSNSGELGLSKDCYSETHSRVFRKLGQEKNL